LNFPETPLRSDRTERPLREFLATEAGSAGILLTAALVALVWANTGLSSAYDDLWSTRLSIHLGGVGGIDLDLRHWVVDGLMALFFYVIGLEIRREWSMGELRDRRAAALPALAALAGMVVPALVYVAINAGGEGAHGWGIPMATDIAFVLGALALLGSRVPSGVRVFLLTLAIVDDIGAITVIAVFYTEDVRLEWLAAAAAMVVVIAVLRRLVDMRGPAYAVVGVVLWVAVLKSGIHPTIAGVVLGVMTAVHPPRPAELEHAAAIGRILRRSPSAERARETTRQVNRGISANERFQEVLHPWTSYAIVPLFALAEAGVDLRGGVLGDAAGSPITLGIVAALVVGKLVGISAASLGAARAGIGTLPTGMTTRHVFGAAALAGIGFTVSLFVAELSFDDHLLTDEAKVGVLAASVLAGALGTVVLGRGARSESSAAP
jgi:Na+/H+ antiporter NhaA